MAKLSESATPTIRFTETAAGSISTPPSGKWHLFVDTDNTLKLKDDAGSVTTIGSGGGAGDSNLLNYLTAR